MTGMSKLYRIALVLGSQRAVRCCPQISQFVQDIIEFHQATKSDNNSGNSDESANEGVKIEFTTLDIADFNLPLTDETRVPAHLTDTPADYDAESTRAWSRAVSSFNAFIFVTPQYNWAVPAGLKNAIDHLFHEWKGKPAMVVSYGGHGGGMAAAGLITTLSGMGVRVVRRPVCLAFPGPEFFGKASKGLDLELDAGSDDGVWADRRGDITALWEEMLGVLVGTQLAPSVKQEGLLELWKSVIPPVLVAK